MIGSVHPLAAQTRLEGEVLIPASKSHTIRALLIAALADGESLIINPLESKDARSCIETIKLFGAEVEEISGAPWGAEKAIRVKGAGSREKREAGKSILTAAPENVIDCGNSGTTIYLATSLAALSPGYTVFTGDHQTRSRPIGNLLRALRELGVEAFSTRSNDKAPIIVRGPIRGGRCSIEAPTSQFLSSLLLALPLAKADLCEIDVPLLHEQPYAEMTLRWLDEQGIRYENVGGTWKHFKIPGRQAYKAFEKFVPGDFSSATFFACAAAISSGKITMLGLDMGDSQGDKQVLDILKSMGCLVIAQNPDSTKGITVIGPGHPENPTKQLKGGRFDLNPIPDALPALSVTACYASETVELINVPQARLKETDRIAMMHRELSALGAQISEKPDGLVISNAGRGLNGGRGNGHDDHRIVMSLALAALRAKGPIEIEGAEAAAVTFPNFFALLKSCGAKLKVDA